MFYIFYKDMLNCKHYILLQIAAFFTIPFDVVKTHRQIEIGEKEIYSGKYFLYTFDNR